MESVSGHIIDIEGRRIYPGHICIDGDKIVSIEPGPDVPDRFILPGFIDAHIHIESSMVTPSAFAEAAVEHGTVATVSDPHEIANVCGLEGIHYMIEDARRAAIHIFFGAPSCVPATSFETTGASIGPEETRALLALPDIWYLSEMMNYPGVIHRDPDVIAKIKAAKEAGKPVDGHAPGVRGENLKQYRAAGIETDHECVSLEEALEKLELGMKILIREGSAAKNFEALHPLLASHPDKVMLCSDDKHPDDLVDGHINTLVLRALHLGYDLFDVLRAACINPVRHYNLPVGTLRPGDPADFIIVENTNSWNVIEAYIRGCCVFRRGEQRPRISPSGIINSFANVTVKSDQMAIRATSSHVPVIQAIDGSLITEKVLATPLARDNYFVSDPDRDLLKICILNRFTDNARPSVGWITGFGLRNAAIASTVAHDSHNIICVGDDDEKMAKAMQLLIEARGGLSCVSEAGELCLPLPVAGLMSQGTVRETGEAYSAITALAKRSGCGLHAPFMTLSFMALLVIPKIKISDIGMFDAEEFRFFDDRLT